MAGKVAGDGDRIQDEASTIESMPFCLYRMLNYYYERALTLPRSVLFTASYLHSQ